MLIVDDNATNRRILMLQTEKWGMAPRETESPREALKWVTVREGFDLAILDVQMPEIDGITLTRELHKVREPESLPIILLTSLGRKEIECRGPGDRCLSDEAAQAIGAFRCAGRHLRPERGHGRRTSR